MDLLRFEFQVLGFEEGCGFLSGGFLKLKTFHEVREIGADWVALEQSQTREPDVVGVEVAGFLEAEECGVVLNFPSHPLEFHSPGVGDEKRHIHFIVLSIHWIHPVDAATNSSPAFFPAAGREKPSDRSHRLSP